MKYAAWILIPLLLGGCTVNLNLRTPKPKSSRYPMTNIVDPVTQEVPNVIVHP